MTSTITRTMKIAIIGDLGNIVMSLYNAASARGAAGTTGAAYKSGIQIRAGASCLHIVHLYPARAQSAAHSMQSTLRHVRPRGHGNVPTGASSWQMVQTPVATPVLMIAM